MKKNFADFVTCGQMKILEQRADESGLSYYQMMENAGTGAAEIIMEKYACRKVSGEDDAARNRSVTFVASSLDIRKAEAVAEDNVADFYDAAGDSSRTRVMVFCGKGNNGGDGFVVARIMCQAGYRVTVVLVDGEPRTSDSITNFRILKDMPVRIIDMDDSDRALMSLKEDPDIIVDAMYGTGFRGKLKSNGLKAAIYINNRFRGTDNVILMKPVMVVALDIPSGLRGDMTTDKELDPCTVTAHYTITFHARKPVHLQSFATKFCGEVIVADIGIDAEKLWGVEL